MCESHYRRYRRFGTATPPLSSTGKGLRDPVARFWTKVDKSGDCWLWMGTCYQNGYGNTWDQVRGRKVLAHRYSYEISTGPIADGMEVCHTCDDRRCVRPDHLFLGTRQQNADDMAAKGRGVQPWRAAEGVCKHGHSLADAYQRTTRAGRPTVVCRTCTKLENDRQYLRRKALR